VSKEVLQRLRPAGRKISLTRVETLMRDDVDIVGSPKSWPPCSNICASR
jgi:hypothetical protein